MGLLEIGRGPTEIVRAARVLEMPIVIWIHVTQGILRPIGYKVWPIGTFSRIF